MDFTLSLAHFCELHGPTTVLCTQALPVTCSICYPVSTTSSQAQFASSSNRSPQPPTHPPRQGKKQYIPGRENGLPDYKHYNGAGNGGDGCVSCCISLPHDASSKLPAGAPGSPMEDGSGRNGSPILRSKETIHSCGSEVLDFEDDQFPLHLNSPASLDSRGSASSCHTHTLTYVSTATPTEPTTFSILRRATIRTLSGEQLPRGQTSGPLWFGDSSAGYTIGYKFRLADPHARGRQRYYAMIALVGPDARRAFEAGAYIWAFFEQIATKIIETAEQFARRTSAAGGDLSEKREFTPVSSFLTGRMTHPEGLPRRNGAGNVRASSLAELAGNEQFFLELHKNFVVSLQNLGRLFDGMRVEPPAVTDELVISTDAISPELESHSCVDEEEQGQTTQPDIALSSEVALQKMTQIAIPFCDTGVLLHRHQVAV